MAMTAVLGIAVFCYVCLKLTAEVDLEGVETPNILDAREAERKLALFSDAMKIARRGFVRLSEVEINSYIEQRYFGNSASPAKTTGTAGEPGARVLRAAAFLSHEAVTWTCWVRGEWFGRPREWVWQRTFELVPNCPEASDFRLASMSVGQLQIPRVLWPQVQAAFADVDDLFTHQAVWLANVPAVEIKTNVFSLKPEVRLFTYHVNGAK